MLTLLQIGGGQMKKYKVVLATDIDVFEEDIEKLLAEEWQCQGGIAVSLDEKGHEWFHQAMVKETDE